jgi:hypothetical protein
LQCTYPLLQEHDSERSQLLEQLDEHILVLQVLLHELAERGADTIAQSESARMIATCVDFIRYSFFYLSKSPLLYKKFLTSPC